MPIIPYYKDDWVTLYLGQCKDVLPQLPPVDHVICDPPYSDHTHKKQWIGHALTKGKARNGTAFTELGFDCLSAELRDVLASQAARLARRWSLFFSDLEGTHDWIECLRKYELDYVRTCIWDKVDSAPQFTGDRPAASAEAIVLAHPSGKKRWNGGGRRNVFRHVVNGVKGSKPHPSTKPQGLMRELVELFTDEGDLIVDPCCGSGSTLRAAKDLGRYSIGIESQEKWAEVAANRMSQGVLWSAQPELITA